MLAFEPEALNYAQLNRNIVLNGLAGSPAAFPGSSSIAYSMPERPRRGRGRPNAGCSAGQPAEPNVWRLANVLLRETNVLWLKTTVRCPQSHPQ